MTIWKLKDLFVHANSTSAEINNNWVPARPVGLLTIRNKIRAVMLVLRNKADVVVWPEGQ